MRFVFAVAAVLLASLTTQGRAVTVTLAAVADNTLYESPIGARSNGIGQHFFAGRTAESDSALRRGLVRFDVSANLPEDAVVLSATLILHLSTTAGGAHPVRAHRVLEAWGEGTSDAPLQEGAGAAATPGDATWIHRLRPSLLWSLPGGDFAPVPSAVIDVAGVGDYTWSSPQLAADVQAWMTSFAGNFGWVLIGDENFPSTAKRFDSRENPDPTLRPRLLLEFATATDAPPLEAWTALRAHPNPFRDRVVLKIDPASPVVSRLVVFDARGRIVRDLAVHSDARSWSWDGRDARGVPAPAGVYIARLRSPSATHQQRLVRLQ